MAHIDYTRRIVHRAVSSLEQIMPLTMGGCNFAAFGGSQVQRVATAAQAAARYCGRCGIVALINAPTGNVPNALEQALCRLPGVLRESNGQDRRVRTRSMNGMNYDPFYGLDETAVQTLLFPQHTARLYMQNTDLAFNGLRAYLKIVRWQFQQNPSLFGRYPFNLNLLLQLTAMPYPRLEQTVLRYLPGGLYDQVQPILSKSDVQTSVFGVVDTFGTMMQKYLWTPGDFSGHSRVSIVQSVTDREIICIRVPNSAPELMHYVEAELNQLTVQGIPYLLLSDGLKLSNCPALQDRFLNEHQSYYTGILAESMSSIADNDVQQAQVFGQYSQILVYQCASTTLAEPFSAGCGSYRRQEIHTTFTRHRQPFRIFSSVGVSNGVVYVDERNIRPEELTVLCNGVLVCGKLYSIPIKISNFRINGGVNNGLHLQQLPPGI